MIEAAGLCVSIETVSHPLLGRAHVIEHGGRVVTAMSAIDWDRPTTIPTVAEPGRLPAGTGGALLNLIAERARAAGVPALRYAGPYPTPALYRTLVRSFRASADEAAFTRDVLQRALALSFDEIPIDFAPAPHERISIQRGHVERRDGIERIVIDQIGYEPEGSPARLVGRAAEVWFGDAVYARVAEVDSHGQLIDGPHALPASTSPVLGQAFPPPLAAALAELVAEVVPAPLAADVAVRIAGAQLAWADLGARAARVTPEGFAIHAALWDRLAPFGLARVALAIAEALAPVAVTAVLAQVMQSRR